MCLSLIVVCMRITFSLSSIIISAQLTFQGCITNPHCFTLSIPFINAVQVWLQEFRFRSQFALSLGFTVSVGSGENTRTHLPSLASKEFNQSSTTSNWGLSLAGGLKIPFIRIHPFGIWIQFHIGDYVIIQRKHCWWIKIHFLIQYRSNMVL